MSNLSAWDVVAGNNNATPPDGAPENMLRSAVNNTMREMMAAVARWYQDNLGTLVSTSASNAYAVTTNSGHAAKADIGFLTFRVDAANTAAVTLDVDELGATTWNKRSNIAYASGDLIANQLVTVIYNPNTLEFETVGTTGEFDSGHETLSFAAAADNGWTKDTTANLNDTALRLVTGTPTSRVNQTAFSSVFGVSATNSHSLTVSQIPSHSHGAGTLSAATHDHSFGSGRFTWNDQENYQTLGGTGKPGPAGAKSTSTSNSGALSVGGSTSDAGGDGGHTHGIELRTNYHDVIKIIKN